MNAQRTRWENGTTSFLGQRRQRPIPFARRHCFRAVSALRAASSGRLLKHRELRLPRSGGAGDTGTRTGGTLRDCTSTGALRNRSKYQNRSVLLHPEVSGFSTTWISMEFSNDNFPLSVPCVFLVTCVCVRSLIQTVDLWDNGLWDPRLGT